jgi:molybdate transport system ATP-binding protein
VLRADLHLRIGDLDLQASVDVAAGRCLALTGPSGAGKSTILGMIAGTVNPDRGRISCDGKIWLDTARAERLPPERRRCGCVFQDQALFPHLCAWRNVAYGLRETPRRQRRSRALELLERFGLSDRAHARPSTLSAGERQRVALARALACKPRVLLLDEPLSALDARTRAGVREEIAAVLCETKAPTILVTHDFTEAALLGDEVAVIEQGRIVQRGGASELAVAPRSAFVADLTGTAAPAAAPVRR